MTQDLQAYADEVHHLKNSSIDDVLKQVGVAIACSLPIFEITLKEMNANLVTLSKRIDELNQTQKSILNKMPAPPKV